MDHLSVILFKGLVKPFYKENAGRFLFAFILFFGVIGGAGVISYHTSLINSMLQSEVILLIVFFVWLLYVAKFSAFVTSRIKSQQFEFLGELNSLTRTKRIRLFLVVEIWLMIPILLYSIFIIWIGIGLHFYIKTGIIITYLFLLCFITAINHVTILNGRRSQVFLISAVKWNPVFSLTYPSILIRFIANQQKMLWVGLKFFTCGLLYLLARNNQLDNPDTPTIFVFFNFGLFANGVLIYRIRSFESTYLGFYRGLPVTLVRRFIQYCVAYLIILIPEFCTLALLTPLHMTGSDAINFGLSSFALLVLMNSISFLRDFGMQEYLKILLLLLGLQYFFMMVAGLALLAACSLLVAFLFFTLGYYKFEKAV